LAEKKERSRVEMRACTKAGLWAIRSVVHWVAWTAGKSVDTKDDLSAAYLADPWADERADVMAVLLAVCWAVMKAAPTVGDSVVSRVVPKAAR